MAFKSMLTGRIAQVRINLLCTVARRLHINMIGVLLDFSAKVKLTVDNPHKNATTTLIRLVYNWR